MSSEHGRPQESVAETTPQGPHVAALGEESGAASGVVGADGRGVLEDAEVAARKRSIAKLRNVVWAAGPARGLVYFKVQHVRDALAAYDALLAERDALKDSLAMEREQVEIGATARNELHNEVQAYMKEKRAEIDALKAELAALKEKAERLHHIATSYLVELYIASDQFHCLSCRVTWMNGGEKPLHAPGCPAAPDFLTTSATESREAKGASS